MTLPSQPLRLAVAQTRAEPGRVARNARWAAELAARAADTGARVLVLPELHLGGYDLARVAGSAVLAGDDGVIRDRRLTPLISAASRHALTVLAGAAVRHPAGQITNSVLGVDAAGARARYDKQHLWHGEAAAFTAGRSSASLTVDGWRLGLGVCYDVSFPEHARESALAGAHVYLCPGAFAAGSEHRARIYLAARALENTMFAAFANPVGGPASRLCDGGSAIWAPDGRPLALAGPGEELLRCDLDPAELARIRGVLPMLAECRAQPAAVPA